MPQCKKCGCPIIEGYLCQVCKDIIETPRHNKDGGVCN